MLVAGHIVCLFLAAAEGVHVHRQRLDGGIIQSAGPRRHDAAAAIPDACNNRIPVRAVEPDRIGQVWRAKLARALSALAVAGGAIVSENLLACGKLGIGRDRKLA